MERPSGDPCGDGEEILGIYHAAVMGDLAESDAPAGKGLVAPGGHVLGELRPCAALGEGGAEIVDPLIVEGSRGDALAGGGGHWFW